MAEPSFWQRIMPPLERLSEPGSSTTTTAGVYLAYASPVFLTISFVPVLDGDLWVALGAIAFAVGSWVLGHWLVSR